MPLCACSSDNNAQSMGQQFCCKRKVLAKLPDLEQDLKLTNSTLLEEISRLRDEHLSFIAASSIHCGQTALFRGRLDQNRLRRGYGEFYQHLHAYFGCFEGDLPQGYGLAIKDSEEYYRGNFHLGLFHGLGKECGPNYEFEGEFESGKRKKGTFKNDHFEYEGQFLDNTFHGQGRITFTNGASYEGQFVGGQMQGQGLLVLENGKYYKGQFKEGKLAGGKLKWLQGAKRHKYVKPLNTSNNELVSSSLTLGTDQKPARPHPKLPSTKIQPSTQEPLLPHGQP